MLNAKVKELKRQGKENVEHKEPITKTDLALLKTGPVLRLNNPLSLLRNVWFNVVLFWCRRGREGQRELKPTSFRFCTDEKGKHYATMAHDEKTKNYQGGLQDKGSNEKTARMYETESETDGYTALKLYLSKLNPKCQALFQFPRRDWTEANVTDKCWYENRPLGVNSLGTMMKEISKNANLSQAYTNHCVRASAITLWSDAGLEDRQICHISGHRNPANLRHYHRPSARQLRQCSGVLSRAFDGDSDDETPQQVLQPLPLSQSSVTSVQTSTTASSSAVLHGEVLGGMFNSCTIHSVQVYFNAPPQNQR